MLELEVDDAGGEHVVQGGDEARDLLGADALVDHPLGELPDVAGDAHQLVDRQGMADVAADGAQADLLEREQISLGDDTDELPILDQGHVANAVLLHGERRFERGRIRRETDHAGAHHRPHRPPERARLQRHVLQQIVQREDAERPILRIAHEHRADVLRLHEIDDLGERRIRSTAHGWPPGQRRERAAERLLRECAWNGRRYVHDGPALSSLTLRGIDNVRESVRWARPSEECPS